ncbi:MAG TPA: response regulator transcription factor [Acidimicrobiales bacterium]|nr:response regulator transcription factor [Acidimicrobiales bacterium]
MITVLVADDEALVREGLRAIAELEGDIEVVAEASNGDEAVARTRTHKPDVVLMDIRMPGVDGLEATRRILCEQTPPKIIILTTFDHNEYVYEAMKAGASGFLLKDVRRGQLAAAIRDAVAGETLVAPTIVRRLIEDFCRPARAGAELSALPTGLTAREIEVLTLVGRGLSNREISDQLFVAETTVKTHVARILGKLGLRDRAQAVIAAYESGLIRPGAD